MKMIRTEFNYPAATRSVPLSFGNVRASCEFPVAAFPLSAVGGQSESGKRKAPAYAGELHLQAAAEQRQTDFWENVIFSALGASGLVGVAVSLL